MTQDHPGTGPAGSTTRLVTTKTALRKHRAAMPGTWPWSRGPASSPTT